ncbi:uncharacterized protein F5147DRAFT_678952 [Suillus discolor]|uniref:DUF6533 domain-containing protein n=1 Tax=Suillus discolor TaxID=1912936 RepID=A0A9P7JXG9_9AGAM|nr:uncharacterized protein F5147DRAFT_678952 [Suillus discolor]KAG2114312.1 hypothetical protein F5147DRAFT_678952 [Suillus discolor]
MATFWIYDYACLLDEEWTFLLRSHWTKMKGLYIVTRFLPLILCAMGLYRNLTPLNIDPCRVLANVESGLDLVLVSSSEWFFILRTFVLWDQNRFLLATMLCFSFTFIATSFGIVFATVIPAACTTGPIPGITGYNQISISFWYLIPCLLLSVFKLGLLILTLIRAIQDWRTNESPLYVVLVNHNIYYYACGLLFSFTDMFTSLLLHYSYRSVWYHLQMVIIAILATRMHLHLWQVNQHLHDSAGALVPMSEISFENHTV